MAPVDEVRTAVERTVPGYVDRRGDWAGVLSQARAGERAGRTRLTWPVVGLAAVAAVSALVLFWPSGQAGDGIIDRARAAVAGGPVVHVVLREAPVEVYDLSQNEYLSLPAELEQWYDPDRGLHEVETIGSKVGKDQILSTGVASIVAAYRQAIAADEAALGPEETVDGHRVYWIRFQVEQPWGTEAHEVAVDADTYEPQFLRVEGGPLATVLSYESLPAGAGDFTPGHGSPGPDPRADGALWSAPSYRGARTAAQARAALKGALWLGAEFRAIPLASIVEVKHDTGVPAGIFPQSVRALELCYGSGELCTISVTLSTSGHRLATSGHPWFFEPPADALAFSAPNVGFVLRDGVHVTLVARDRDELIAAAKALAPIP